MPAEESTSPPTTIEPDLLIAFRSMAECLPESMLLLTQDLVIVAANQAAAQMLKVSSPRDLEGTLLTSGSDATDAKTRSFIQMCMTSARFMLGSVQYLPSQGSVLDFRAEGATFRRFGDLAANLVLLRLSPKALAAASFLDISRQIEHLNLEISASRESERSLRLSESRFRNLAESVPAIVWSFDETGLVDYANENYCQYTGYKHRLVDMVEWLEVIHPDQREVSRRVYDDGTKQGIGWESELRLKRWDGEYRWHLARCVPLPNPERERTRWIASSFDIHAVKAAEEVLRSANSELERRVAARTHELELMNRELEGFTYSVSHDLRTPLRAIVGTCRILEEDHSENLPPDALHLLHRQAAAANRLGNLIDDLLRFSRLGRQHMDLVSVDLSELGHEVFAELATHGAIFETEPGLTARCDANVMRLTLGNLIGNALKFCKAGESPRVSFGRSSTGEFFVRDEGIGFDPQYADKVFLPFERLHSEQEYPGTGIGLANVKLAIERHGGRVRVETQPGEGATFFFTLQEPEPKLEKK